MASKLDEFDMKAPVADLLYPSVEKHNAMKKRAAALEKLPRAFVDNLELEKVADFITPHYQYRVMRLFCEVCDDEEVINYRLDILDDFIRLPSLSATIRKVINVMVENDRKNIYNLTTPDSFSQLDDAISGFDAYIQCMEIMHDFYGKMKDKIRSEGVKKLFAFFEEHYGDKHYISLKGEIEKLKNALHDRIRSVTVAINLDERLVPVSAGIIELSKERYDIKPSLVDRILYHGAKFNDKAVVKNLRKKYNDSEVSDDKLINTVDKTLFAEAYHHPHKLPQNYDYKIVVEDKANVLGKTAELRNSLVAFYNRTGISPAVITVENSDWQGNYSDLENYAYDLYVNHFADESHWLIVYSTPDGHSSSDGFEDWYWEGMQGNDTDDVLTESVTNSFNDELQKNLTARTRYTVSSAISTSFDDLTPTVMKSKVNWTMLFTSIAILAFVCLHACLMIGINPKARKYAKAKPCSDAAQEKACEYCGYTYVVDTCTECPHCGAPIPPEDQPGARFT